MTTSNFNRATLNCQIPRLMGCESHIVFFPLTPISLETVDIFSDEGVVLRAEWKFTKKRGAAMSMYKPQITRVPEDFFQAAVSLPVLKDKYIVYEVWQSRGYFMYLSNKCKYSQHFIFVPMSDSSELSSH
jgi:hypothetical protein